MYLRNGFGRLEPPDGDRVVEKPKNYCLGEEHLPPGRKKREQDGPEWTICDHRHASDKLCK